MRRSRLTTVTAAAILVLAAGFLAQVSAGSQPVGDPSVHLLGSAGVGEDLGPLAADVVQAPQPVLGTDGRWHLVYEIALVNAAPIEQVVTSLRVRDAQTRRLLLAYDTPDEIREVMTTSTTAGSGVDELPANGAGEIFLDVSSADEADLPGRLVHRIDSAIPSLGAEFTMRGATSPVHSRSPLRLSAPLLGRGYVNENGCCARSDHTRAVLIVDGKRWLAQRFAIDFVRVDSENRTYVGDFRVNENWAVYGDPIVSASSGRVVETLNTLPDNTPPTPAEGLTPFTALGNHVIVAAGDDRYVLYAHMQPGSVQVEVGDRVRPGEYLGDVGNSGSSVAPHLHFHVTDAARAISSNGAPYVIDRFRLTHRVLNVDDINATIPTAEAMVEPAPLPRRRTEELPLTGDLFRFPGSRADVD